MNPDTIHACIIIDDPLLRENYGFLNYRELLEVMDLHNFFTTIAFIPWNYNRTDKRIADLFQERPDRFSLCVHGCDHTEGEFAKTDLNHLDKKVKLATARMIEHEKRTGIPFDRIMVFPQGKFSNEAMETLRRNNYLAAVNTEARPVNGHYSSNFPLFIRKRPEEAINSVFDPAFVVLHHDYFKNGYGRLAEFVDELNGRTKYIKWDGVGNIVRHHLSLGARGQNVLNPNVHGNSADGPNDVAADVDLRGLQLYGYEEYLKISMRRYVSEFRDNYLCKNESILNRVKAMKNVLKM